MRYNKTWKEKEKIFDSKISQRDNLSKRLSKKHILGINLHDVLSIRNWLFYAKKINDQSYKKVFNGNLESSYIEDLLSNQLDKRINFFSKFKDHNESV